MVQADGDMEGLAQLLPELGGDEQPPLGIDIVCVLAGHGCPSFPGFLWDCVGLSPTNMGNTPTTPHFYGYSIVNWAANCKNIFFLKWNIFPKEIGCFVLFSHKLEQLFAYFPERKNTAHYI